MESPVKSHDDFEAQYWLTTAAVGGWITLLLGLSGGSYVALFASPAHRLGVGVMLAVTIATGASTLWLVPWRRIIASQWREGAFLSWSILTIAMVALLAAFDGGARSPLALSLFLPAVFASLAYPLRLVVVVGVLAELAFLALALLDAPAAGYVTVFCSILAGTAFMAVWQAASHDAWRRELARSSRTDPLTGLLNRRGFAMASEAAFSALVRRGRPVTLAVIDLDLFKAYNDGHGHQAGDDLLGWVAAQLSTAVRPTDVVARLGGDEFAVLFPDTGPDSAEAVIVRLVCALEPRAAHCLGRASAPEHGATFDALYRAADADLYQHKIRRPHAAASGEAPFANVTAP